MMEQIGGRKFVYAVLALVLGFILVMSNKVDANQFLEFTKWIAGIFVVGNATVDVAGIMKGDEK